jgi:hypothetical protein
MLQMRSHWISVLVLLSMAAAAPQALAEDEKSKPTSVRIIEPETLNGRPKVTDPEVQESLAEMEKRVKDAIPGEENVVVAMYGDLQGTNMVRIVAVDRATAEGDLEVNGIFQRLRDRGFTVSKVESTNPGPLGGIAKCAEVNTPSGGQSICAWADEQSVGSVTFFLKKREEAKSEFVGIRSLIEQRR